MFSNANHFLYRYRSLFLTLNSYRYRCRFLKPNLIHILATLVGSYGPYAFPLLLPWFLSNY
jgi:hypothetical protein